MHYHVTPTVTVELIIYRMHYIFRDNTIYSIAYLSWWWTFDSQWDKVLSTQQNQTQCSLFFSLSSFALGFHSSKFVTISKNDIHVLVKCFESSYTTDKLAICSLFCTCKTILVIIIQKCWWCCKSCKQLKTLALLSSELQVGLVLTMMFILTFSNSQILRHDYHNKHLNHNKPLVHYATITNYRNKPINVLPSWSVHRIR